MGAKTQIYYLVGLLPAEKAVGENPNPGINQDFMMQSFFLSSDTLYSYFYVTLTKWGGNLCLITLLYAENLHIYCPLFTKKNHNS
jgi:hypothetical protein